MVMRRPAAIPVGCTLIARSCDRFVKVCHAFLCNLRRSEGSQRCVLAFTRLEDSRLSHGFYQRILDMFGRKDSLSLSFFRRVLFSFKTCRKFLSGVSRPCSTMFCGQCVRLLISMYSMSIFGPAAVTAARHGLEPAAWLSYIWGGGSKLG